MDLIERLKKKKIINEDNTFNPNKEERTEGTKQYTEYEEKTPITRYSAGIQSNVLNTRHIKTSEINRNTFNYINDRFNQFKKQFKTNPIKTTGTIWDRVQAIKNNSLETHQPSTIEERMKSYSNFQRVTEARNQNKQQVENGLQQRKQEQLNQLQQQMKQLEEQENNISQNNPKLPTNDKDRYNTPINNKNSSVGYSLSSKEEIENAKKLTAEKLYELTDGKSDERIQFQKSIDTLKATAGNIGLGVLESVNNVERFAERGSQVATKKLISKTLQNKGITKETADTVGKILSDEGIKQYEDKILDVKTSKQNDEMLNKAVQKNIQKGGSLAELGEQLGSNAGSMAIGSFNPLVGSAFAFGSAGGSYIKDAEQRGMTDEQQLKYAVPMAFAEAGTEYVGLEPLAKAGKTAKALAKGSKVISKEVAKDTTKQVLKNYGISIADNMIQEAIIEPIQELTAGAVADKANWDNMSQRMLESGVKGGLFAMVTGGASLGIQSCVGVVQKANSGQEITEQEFKTAIEDANKRINPKETISNYIKENIANQNAQNWINKAQDIVNQENTQQLPQQQNTPQAQTNLTQEQNNVNQQQINQEENNVAQNQMSEQIKVDSENFSKQVDSVLKGTFPQKDMLTLGKTPQVLKDIGLRDLPITMTQKHLDTIMNESGKYKNANYHGLGEDVVKQLPEAINNPLDIVKSNTKDDSIVLTTYLADKNNNTVIASIKIDGKGKVNDIIIDTNVMTSAYGKSNYDNFMKKNLDEGNLLYDIDRGVIKKLSRQGSNYLGLTTSTSTARPQLPRSDSSINNSVPQNKNIVKENTTINNQYMQNNQNNAIMPIKKQQVKFENDNQIQESNKINDEQVAKILTEPVNKNNEKRKLGAFLKANLIDKGIIFEELSRKTGNRDLQGKYDYTLTAEARGQNAIGNARYDYQTISEDGKIKKGNKDAKQISKSLTDIIDEVGEEPSDFYNYMYHQLNIDRMTLEERFGGDTGINYERTEPIKNKPVFGEKVTADISRKIVSEMEQKHPEFKEYAKDVYDYLDANMQELVNNGVISEELRDNLKERYPHYVPISRITDKGMNISVPLDTGRTGINTPLKRAKGGNQDIKPLFQTMADRTLQTYRASARNNFGVELKNTLQKSNQLNQSMETTDIDTIIENMTDEIQNKELLQEGKNGENPTFTVFENGEKVTYEISKDMYDALKPKNELLKRLDESKVSKGLNKFNNFRRGLLTEYNPVFSITNAIKDSQDILLNSQHSAKTYSKMPEATAQILGKGYWYKEYVQNGGEQNSYFKDGDFQLPKQNLPTKAKNIFTAPLRAISNVNNVIEMTPRLAEYIASRQEGKSIETSMLDASRVTTNFKAGGDITKTLNRNGFTFLNASVQGMQQQVRNIQEANAKGLKGWAVLATKYTIAGLPALLLNNVIWNDDDDYRDLQDYVKDNYYIIGKTKNGTFIRIPKGRAVATIQKIVSNADEYVKTAKSGNVLDIDKLGSQFWEDLKEDISFAKDNLAPNNPMDNNVLAPIIQAVTNKTWYGDELVPSRLQDKPSIEQYDESTDKFSRWLGEKTGISPIKINYLIDQYSGGVGDVILPMLTPQAENTVLQDKFTTDPIMKSKYPGDFFSKVDELKINSNSDKSTDEDILKYKYISDISSDISKLYKQKREIQNANISDEEKKKQLKSVQKQINDLAKNSLSKVDNITKGKNYAQIDKNQYYKDAEGEWKTVSDKDKEKNKEAGISLKTYSSYKYQMSKVKQEKVNKGELTKEQSLKDKDKIQILLDSNYTNSDKSAIYESYIKTQPKEGEVDLYKALKETKIDINQYLKYEQQKFESDKKDDGTVDGKTITNSKKSKVFEYVNSNISGYNNRLLILGSQYKLSTSERKKIYEIINTLPNTSKEERMQLYGKMKGFTVYKNGTVSF